MAEKEYDVSHMADHRSIFILLISAPLSLISQAFNAYVGGSPLNIAVGTQRLGLKSALLTGIGQDQVGDFLLNFLNQGRC